MKQTNALSKEVQKTETRRPIFSSQNLSRQKGGSRKHSFRRNRRESLPRPAKKVQDKIPPAGDNLRIIPLGGVEEIGKNMTVIEFRDEIIVVDAGIEFTDIEENPGI